MAFHSPVLLEVPHVEIRTSDVRRVPDVDFAEAGAPCLVPMLQEIFKGREQESFVIIMLDVRGRSLAWREVSRGSGDQCMAPARDIFRAALLCGGMAMVFSHNHPSGNPSPSPQDLEVTNRLAQAGYMLGIPIVDHIIIGDGGRYFSFREEAAAMLGEHVPGMAEGVSVSSVDVKRQPPELD